jgi:hypothetical protein
MKKERYKYDGTNMIAPWRYRTFFQDFSVKLFLL